MGRRNRNQILSMGHVRWSELDWSVLFLAGALLLTGMTFLASMDASELALGLTDAGGVDYAGHKKKVLITLPLVFLSMLIRPGWLQKNAGWIYGACLVLLLLVMFIGDERNHARRWIQLPMFDLQPSELAKVGVILMLAAILATNRLERLADWFLPLIVVAIPMAMVATQPDLGTALTLVPISLGMLYLAGGSGWFITALVLTGALLGWGVKQNGWIQEYQWHRVETWASTFSAEDLIRQRNGSGYHQYQARVCLGDGGLWGRGVGQGVANQAGHLPERDSDSIFPVIAEEAGWIGASGLILAYGLMVLLLMLSAAKLRDRFGRLVVGGVALYFAAHVVIHVAVNSGLLPMTGLTLPLVSAGGSSLLATLVALGTAVGLASHHEARLDRDHFTRY